MKEYKDSSIENKHLKKKELVTAFYKNGQLHGERTLYHANGAIQAIEPYENGVFKGDFQAFYENKQLELAGKYINGMMNGEWKRYYFSYRRSWTGH